MSKTPPGAWPPEDDSPKQAQARKPGSDAPIPDQARERAMRVVAVIMAVAAAGLFLSGRLGIDQIADDEAAVLITYLSGNKEVITDPGLRIYVPGVQELVKFDKSSQVFTMEGSDHQGPNHVPRLTVRANDGSNFWFEELEILYQIIPEKADVLLEDSGAGDGFKQNWIKAYARSVLRDEFGRFSAIDAADPTKYKDASLGAQKRLNDLLEPHGLKVTRVITPKPRFDAAFEKAIEDRKVANQEVQVQREKQEQLTQERERRLATVLKEKEIEMQALTGDLMRELLGAEQEAIRLQLSANAYAIEQRNQGEAQRDEMLAQARGLEAKYTKEAEGLLAQAEALEERGRVIVREALVDRLADIRFTFLPYSRDPEPQRLEHVQTSGAPGEGIDPSTVEDPR